MSSAYYRILSTYLDTSSPGTPVLYVCTFAGDKTTSVWAKISGGGDSWPPVELDPTQVCAAGDWRYVSPLNPLVTTGLKDLVAGSVIKAKPGLWRAKKAVPAQATVSGVTSYNVPQLPYPGASGTADIDGTNVFWIGVNAIGAGCDNLGNVI